MKYITAALLWVTSAAAQDDKKEFKPDPRIDAKRVDEAIRKGVEFLKKENMPKGIFDTDSEPLKLLTFIHAGVPREDAAFKESLKKCLEAKMERTYQVAVLAMALEELDRAAYQPKIAACAQFLVDNMRDNGHWGYGEPDAFANDVPTTTPKKDVATGGGDLSAKPKVTRKIYIKKRKQAPGERGDNSNSGYAALGLRACMDAGIVFERELLAKAREWWLVSQHPVAEGDKGAGGAKQGPPKDAPGNGVETGPGAKTPSTTTVTTVLGVPRGWCYGEGDPDCRRAGKPYGSMTAGAVGAICIYDSMLGLKWKTDRIVLDGLAWMNKHWSITENPGDVETKHTDREWLYYYLYAVERVGMLYDTKYLGSHDWYYEGAQFILDAQNQDGSWDVHKGGKNAFDTCFAILFLKRSTKRLDVITGDSSHK